MKNFNKTLRTIVSLAVAFVLVFSVAIPVGAAQLPSNILKEVYPATVQTASSQEELKVTAVAQLGSDVTAKLDGKTITLEPNFDILTADNYILHEGYFTLRKVSSQEKSKNVGKVTITANLLGAKSVKYSGDITVINTDTTDITSGGTQEPTDPEEPEEPENPNAPAKPKQDKTPTYPSDIQDVQPNGSKKKQIRVTGGYADTFRYKGTDGYPNGVDYQLVEGTIDTIAKERGNWIDLMSGVTLNKTYGNFEVFTDYSYTKDSNYVQSAYTHANINGTFISLRMGWDSPVTITPTPQPSVAQTVSSFNATQVEIKMPYVTQEPTSLKGNFNNSPLFTEYRWQEYHDMINDVYGYKLILTLKNKGKYYGAHMYKDDDGRYTIRFNHAPYGINSKLPLTGLDVIVDPGHGKSNAGAVAAGGVNEMVYNLQLAKKIVTQLKKQGANVYMIPSDTTALSTRQRQHMIYERQPDLYISAHHNAGSSTASGFEVYYNNPFSSNLGYQINNQVKEIMTARGSKYYNFEVTRSKQVPSVLLETCFISNPSDVKKYTTSAHHDKVAEAVVDGIIAYYK